jgi:UDP-N-acetylmuramoyl-L-alanyl-D-glutamate--2,6-diaminopimelate ligase
VKDRRLVWDTRQAPDGRPELVVVPSDHASEELRAALLGRGNARFVLSQNDRVAVEEALVDRVPNARRALGHLASEGLGHPTRHLRVLGVTGTNGKTTTAGLLRTLMREAGFRVAEIGTLGISVWEGDSRRPLMSLETGFTTPEAPTLHHLFSQLVAEGVTHVAMEVSSHGLELGRVEGVEFGGAVFTNLTQDHLDLHGNMEAYEAAKARLFRELLPWSRSRGRNPVAVFLGSTSAGERILRSLADAYPAVLMREGFDYEVTSSTLAGLRLRVRDLTLESPMVGRFHAENIVGAAELARLALGMDSALLARGIARFAGAAGRLEKVQDPERRGRTVFVDYAHTPDAVRKAIAALKEVSPPGSRLCVVIGCGGDRDRGKRPLMARAAVEGADRVVFTSDNPRTEDPERILDDMVAGVSHAEFARCERVVDRREAIRSAIASLASGDVCLVAGKGHEDYQIVGTEKRPFSDVEESLKALGVLLTPSKG